MIDKVKKKGYIYCKSEIGYEADETSVLVVFQVVDFRSSATCH